MCGAPLFRFQTITLRDLAAVRRCGFSSARLGASLSVREDAGQEGSPVYGSRWAARKGAPASIQRRVVRGETEHRWATCSTVHRRPAEMQRIRSRPFGRSRPGDFWGRRARLWECFRESSGGTGSVSGGQEGTGGDIRENYPAVAGTFAAREFAREGGSACQHRTIVDRRITDQGFRWAARKSARSSYFAPTATFQLGCHNAGPLSYARGQS